MTEQDAWLANQVQPDPEKEQREWQEALSALHVVVYTRARTTRLIYPELSVPQYADAGWAWVRAHPKRVMTAWENDVDGHNPAGSQRLARAIERHMEMTGRREKAALAGYRVEDEAFYPTTLIEMALPAVWDVSYATSAPVALDENGGDGYAPPKRLSDPAEGNNWLASVVDVRRAYQETVLTEDVKWWLRLRYKEHYSVEDVARRSEHGVEYVNHQLESALRKIQRTLGGERPTGCSSSCECGGTF